MIVITRDREDYNLSGVRYYSNGIKVFYLPCLAMKVSIVYPAIFSNMSLQIRSILLREKIQLVHGHQDSSLMVIISVPIAKSLDIPFILTQHSLHNFGDLGSIELNNMYKVFVRFFISHVIGVSNTVRENYYLRVDAPTDKVSVIPNAIDHVFYHRHEDIYAMKDPKIIKIVILTRMCFRKGISLLLELMPIICKKYKQVRFQVCGDGPMKAIAEKIARDYIIESQVEFVGFSDVEMVPKIHSGGDIFLNTSISEAFCLAILEAAACGLYVISTNVGGINEILPPWAISLCPPTAEGLIDAIVDAIENKKYQRDPKKTIEVIQKSYDWNLVSKATAELYQRTITEYKRENHLLLLAKLLFTDFRNWVFYMLVALNVVFGSLCEWLFPPGEAVELPASYGREEAKDMGEAGR